MNKEIEELLNKIKQQVIIDEKLGKEIAKDFHETILNYEETKNLLSYIEQLEKENEKLKQWDKNKDTRNSRQRIANAILMKKIKQLEKEKADILKKECIITTKKRFYIYYRIHWPEMPIPVF